MSLEKQKNLLKELIVVRQKGFIQKLELLLSEDLGKIRYDELAATFSSEFFSPMIEVEKKTTEWEIQTLPKYKSIHLIFSSKVNSNQVQRVSEHICKKYNCRSVFYPSFPQKVDLIGF